MDRRTFIKKSGILTGAAVTVPLADALGQTLDIAKPALNTGIKKWKLASAFDVGTIDAKALVRFAKFIADATEDKLQIQIFHAGQLVEPRQCMTAVQKGKAEIGFGSPSYWKKQNPALPFIASMPFGLCASEQNAWLYHGGGLRMANSIYNQLGVQFFPMGNTGTQMGGWFKKEVNRVWDLRDLRMRMSGLGGQVLNSLGATAVSMSGSEILPALKSGRLDAAEWVGPAEDFKKQLHLAAKFYYYPGWHDPGTVRDGFIDLKKWNALPKDQKKIIEYAASYMNMQTKAELQALNHTALRTLTEEHDVKLRNFSVDLMASLGAQSAEILPSIAAKHPDSLKVYNHLIKFRESMVNWSTYSEQAFMASRSNARL